MLGVLVEWCAHGDEGIDVRNRYEDPRNPIIDRFGDRQLIEIARIVVVDRTPWQVSLIGNVIDDWRFQRCACAIAAGGKSGSRPRSSIASRARSAKSRVSIASLGALQFAASSADKNSREPVSQPSRSLSSVRPKHDYRGSALRRTNLWLRLASRQHLPALRAGSCLDRENNCLAYRTPAVKTAGPVRVTAPQGWLPRAGKPSR